VIMIAVVMAQIASAILIILALAMPKLTVHRNVLIVVVMHNVHASVIVSVYLIKRMNNGILRFKF